jgi:hypothetical protein
VLPDLAQARQELSFDRGEPFLVDLAQLESHLRREQLLAQRRLVDPLRLRGVCHATQHPADAADEESVEEDHARSSFRRMLTKL